MVRISRKQSRFRSLVGVCVVIATVLAVAPSASAAGATAGADRTTTTTPKLWSFSSAYGIQPADSTLARFVQFRDIYCPAGGPIADALTLRQALASARQS
jgi:hypothetical protein